MEEVPNWVTALVIGVLLLAIGGCVYTVYRCSASGSCGSSNVSVESNPQPVAKPETVTRCDYSGVLASSIIADEAKQGYIFAGRVSTFLCGGTGMSFYLAPGVAK